MDTVVVIGSGPAGSVSGKDIDRHPVVRIWNHEWQPAERYGSRYDYGLITSIDDAQNATRRPAKAWLFYNVARQDESLIKGDVVSLDWVRWYWKADAAGAKSADGRGLKFTRGFCAVAGAMEHLKPRRVVVIGMDILQNGFTGPKYYDAAALPFYVKSFPRLAASVPSWAVDEMPPGLRGEGPHDYSAESVLIRELAAEAGVELVWGLAELAESEVTFGGAGWRKT